MESKIEVLEKRTDALDKRIDGLQSIMLGSFGVLFSGMMALIGFGLWDRRTALAPAVRQTEELKERSDRLEKVLKEYARNNPKFAEIMKLFNLL